MRNAANLLLSLATLTACAVSAGNPESTRGKLSTPYAGLAGQVVDPEGRPVAGARLEAAGQTASSDSSGSFAMPAPVRLPKKLALRVSHPDFATASLPIAPEAFDGSYLTARMRPVAVRKRMSVAEGGGIAISTGEREDASLIFPPGFLVSGGEVDVAVSIVRPFVRDEYDGFPGSFEAAIPGDRNTLETLGAMEVQLTRDGEPVDEPLARKVVMQMRLAPSQATRFGEGTVVPTWWLDEATGVWQPEGEARVVSQNGELKSEWSARHFTWWNVDWPLESHGCYALKVNVDEADGLFLETLALQLRGVDYFGVSVAAPFDTDGLAVATGWRGRPVDAALVDRKTGLTTVLLAKLTQSLFSPEGAERKLPETVGSGLRGEGPAGVPLDPRRHCLYEERNLNLNLGSLSGVVLDEGGQVMGGAVVSIEEMGLTGMSAADGRFFFEGVPWSPDGELSLTVRGFLNDRRISPVTLVRDERDQTVTLVADVPPVPPIIETAAVDSTSALRTSVKFTAHVVDDRAPIKLGASVCGKTTLLNVGKAISDGKTALCHVSPGSPGSERTIALAPEAVEAHLSHGDYMGICASADPASPPEVDASLLNGGVAPSCTGSIENLSARVAQVDGKYHYTLTGEWRNGNEIGASPLVILAKDDFGYTAQAVRYTYWRNSAPVVSILGTATLPFGATAAYDATASDPDGGPVTLRWSLDGSTLPDTSRTVMLSDLALGPHYLTVEASDGGLTTSHRLTLFVVAGAGVPAGAPETTIVSGPAALSPETSATIGFASSDTAARFECALDSAVFRPCISPFVSENLDVGLHTFAVRAANFEGTDPTPALVTWEIYTGWSTLALGDAGICALRSGELYCWGYNWSGELGVDPSLREVTEPTRLGSDIWQSIDLDGEVRRVACGVKPDTSLWCWGQYPSASDATNETVLVGDGYLDVRADYSMACARRTDKSLWCWGEQELGRLGDGTFVSREYPLPVTGSLRAESFDIGLNTVCAVDTEGGLWCWGLNTNTIPGFPVWESTPVPQRIGIETDWLGVYVGEFAVCATKADRSLWCWGTAPEVGFDDVSVQETPREVMAGVRWRLVDVRGRSVCGVDDTGDQWCWGNNRQGQFANEFIESAHSRPYLSGRFDWSDLVMSRATSCATRNGDIYCWGDNFGGLFPKGPYPRRDYPYPDQSKNDWVLVSGHSYHACGIDAMGDLYCWGGNWDGALGVGEAFSVSSAMPERTRVGADRNWVQVKGVSSDGGSPSEMRTCAIDTEGILWCWGNANLGALGNGTAVSYYPTPQSISVVHRWQDVAPGEIHGCGVTIEGALMCWGQGVDYRLGTGAAPLYEGYPVTAGTDRDWAQVVAGSSTSCALKTDRSLWCWGGNSKGEAGVSAEPVTVPTQVQPGSTWRSIGMSHERICGVRYDDRSLWCWGSNLFGGAQYSPKLIGVDTDWDAVFVGPSNTLGIKTDGSLWAWGLNPEGELGLGSSAPTYVSQPMRVGNDVGWTQAGLGFSYSCAVKDGVLHCMGSQRTYCQFGDQGCATRSPRLVDWP